MLNYDPELGVFTWRVKRSNNGTVNAGDVAGCVNGSGYIVISIDGKIHYAHRLAWLYMKGYPPADQIDHSNTIRTDNRWSNLREANCAENLRNRGKQSNNTSGFKGVVKEGGKWRARIDFNGKKYQLGCFSTIEEANTIRRGAAALCFGEFNKEQP